MKLQQYKLWHKEGKHWTSPQHYTMGPEVSTVAQCRFNILDNMSSALEEECILVPSTPYKDLKGHTIFEGDIVTALASSEAMTYLVIWDEESEQFALKNYLSYLLPFEHTQRLSIIGNRYEYPLMNPVK